MSRSAASIAPSRTLLNVLSRTQTRQCQSQRWLSSMQSSAASARRPVPASSFPRATSQSTLPLVQRRFKYKTVEEAKSRYKSGPFSWKAGVLFVGTGAGLLWYFEKEKERMQRKRVAESTKGVGRPKVGGAFELVDQNGKRVTEEDLMGRYSLVYFGFTHCPDICPEELDKMAQMFDMVEAERPGTVLPVFVTCDPARDTPEVVKEYLKEFHPKFVGLTGTYDQVKAMCKAYRVYFSTPTDIKPGEDYLVDHSIYFYLMDPQGDFVEALGRQHSPEQAGKVILDHVKDWKGGWKTQ